MKSNRGLMGMSFNSNSKPFLYSAVTSMAYKIAKDYYGNVHYAWCSTSFNSKEQPPTSNPATLCERYLKIITTGDRHAREIIDNKAGILKGAKIKLDRGIIDKKIFNEIRALVAASKYVDYYPIIYVVNSRKVKERYLDIPIVEKASDKSEEYLIEDLQENEFQVISLSDILTNVITVEDKRAGK